MMKTEDASVNNPKDVELFRTLFGALNQWKACSSSGNASERRWKKIRDLVRPSCSVSASGWFCMTGKLNSGTSDLIADLREEMSEGM